MKKGAKAKQIVVRFDYHSYDKISDYATIEHRGLGEFVRHAALSYIEQLDRTKSSVNEQEVKRV